MFGIKILKEILDKLNIILSYTMVDTNTSLMDVYNHVVDEQQIRELKNKKPPRLSEDEENTLIIFAQRTGKFKIDQERGVMIVEKDGFNYEIPKSRLLHNE